MLKLTNEQTQELFDGLSKGNSYCGIKDNRAVGSITNFSESYFEIQHYGSVRVQKSVERLQSAIEIMFDDCDDVAETIYDRFHSTYVPVMII